MKVYAFDVDETLEVSSGPIQMDALKQLVNEGHIVGLNGNWAVVTNRVWGWWHYISFLGPSIGEGKDKAFFLNQLKTYIPCEEVVMVGNVLGVSGRSDDKGAADAAGVRFIKEDAFAEGER